MLPKLRLQVQKSSSRLAAGKMHQKIPASTRFEAAPSLERDYYQLRIVHKKEIDLRNWAVINEIAENKSEKHSLLVITKL